MRKIRIYTDGACSGNPGPGGWAVIVAYPYDIKKISGNKRSTTNNEMELKAMLEALKEVLNYNTDFECAFEICSDSAYVINAITKGWLAKWATRGWKKANGEHIKNVELWVEITSIINTIIGSAYHVSGINKTVVFTKVKGHAGEALNEMADRLARQESMEAKG